MLPTPREVAVRVAYLLHKAGETRARLSRKTLERLSRRHVLQGAGFLMPLQGELGDLGVGFFNLGREGFGLIRFSALEGAQAITVKRHMPTEWEAHKSGTLSFAHMAKELEEAYEMGGDAEED